jgi:hypothetical protein
MGHLGTERRYRDFRAVAFVVVGDRTSEMAIQSRVLGTAPMLHSSTWSADGHAKAVVDSALRRGHQAEPLIKLTFLTICQRMRRT